jgi:mRNA interferase MazF
MQKDYGMIDYPKRGEIYLINLPLKPEDKKNRPALVISMDIRNELAGDIIVIPLSSNLRKTPTHVLLDEREAGLLKPSMAKCEQITTLDKSFLVKGPFAGKISENKLKEIEEAIKIAIGIL